MPIECADDLNRGTMGTGRTANTGPGVEGLIYDSHDLKADPLHTPEVGARALLARSCLSNARGLEAEKIITRAYSTVKKRTKEQP